MVWEVEGERRRFLSDILIHDSSQVTMEPIEAGVKAERRGRPEIVLLVMHGYTLFDVRE
jgi:hypothetical protein